MTWKTKFEFRILGPFRVPPQGEMGQRGWWYDNMCNGDLRAVG